MGKTAPTVSAPKLKTSFNVRQARKNPVWRKIVNENKTQTNTVSGANSGYKENASGARKNKESDSPEAKQHEAEEAAKRGADSSDQAHGRRRKIKILASSSDENKEAARAKVFDQIQQLRVNHSRL